MRTAFEVIGLVAIGILTYKLIATQKDLNWQKQRTALLEKTAYDGNV